ncbi:MAG: biotin/lipoate A/B protein ligase family protein [Candidatus Woesearchaeota archaeon]
MRLIKNIEADGAMQMAIDEAILTARRKDLVPNTLRFFTWKPPCLTIGYFQSLEQEIDLEKAKDVDIVRRYTGGGAILHDKELTYSFAISEREVPKDIVGSYRMICGALVKGLGLLGIKAEFKEINDIIVNGKKISGNAQTRKEGIVLQHGTILMDVEVEKMFSFLRISDEKIKDKMIKSAEERVTSVNEQIGNVSIEEVEAAMIKGFEDTFNARSEEQELTDHELRLAERLRAKYAGKEWSYMR